ncbi:MAG: radical SAM/SPASM domain-containing protein [Planctomycetota bacterium]
MKFIAAIMCDLTSSPIGTRSREADELCGVPVLRRTAERVLEVQGLHGVHLLCPGNQQARCARMLDGLRVTVHPVDAGPPPWGALIRAARKWSLDGWRGGLGGAMHFDEFCDCRVLAALLESEPADGVLCAPGSAALLDPRLAEHMLRHRIAQGDDVRLVFAQTPPGLAGLLLDRPLIQELAEKNVPVGVAFSYKPDAPQKDHLFHPCCLEVPAAVRFSSGRMVADTERSFRRMEAVLRGGGPLHAAAIGQWLLDYEVTEVDPAPREVEIELTTEDPYPDALLRPRGPEVGQRGPIEDPIVRRIVEGISRYDDSLVMLGGFGDPLRHPQLATILQTLRPAGSNDQGVHGLALRTAGIDVTPEVCELLVRHRVDVVMVPLDAWTAPLYAALQSPTDPVRADLEAVTSRMTRLSEVRHAAGSAVPILVPELCKSRDNVAELDDFHDGWIRRLGTVCITGYSHQAKQREDRGVIRMAPATRIPCRRIRSRCLVFADGRVTLCDQDHRGSHAVGNLHEQSLAEIWHGSAMQELRQLHRGDRFDAHPLCAACDEWHRP